MKIKSQPSSDEAHEMMYRFFVKGIDECAKVVEDACDDAYKRLLMPSLENEVLNKPEDIADAAKMLKKISGKMHVVYTAVCVRSNHQAITIYDESRVFFNELTDEMINYYLKNFKPLDKAGAYGIQEFIGYVGIRKIEGCYYNVMGFPIAKFIQALKQFK